MRISDWSSDVCSSDLNPTVPAKQIVGNVDLDMPLLLYPFTDVIAFGADHSTLGPLVAKAVAPMGVTLIPDPMPEQGIFTRSDHYMRSEEHTSELQSLMRISYAVFCLKKKNFEHNIR